MTSLPASAAFLLTGTLLLVIVLTGPALARAFVTGAMLYLALGLVAGLAGVNVGRQLLAAPHVLERAAECALVFSLFSVGLKMGSAPLSIDRWRLSLRLGLITMLATAALVTLAAWQFLELPLAHAVLLAGVLAPTDPVLASGVQTEGGTTPESLRFGLAGEGGLNDGTAYPIVTFGLGLVGLRDLGAGGWRWWTVDVVWSTCAGIAIGATIAVAIGRLVVRARLRHPRARGLDEFVSLGLVLTAYGAALVAHASGFLAVFAAGVALQRVHARRARAAGGPRQEAIDDANSAMTEGVLAFNEQLEKLAELAMVLVVGVALAVVRPSPVAWAFALGMLVVVRPLGALAGLAGAPVPPAQRVMIGWFGIRGIGSVYYLAVVLGFEGEGPWVQTMIDATFATVALSIVLHGATVRPLARWYASRTDHR